jgi:hypothetical protein
MVGHSEEVGLEPPNELADEPDRLPGLQGTNRHTSHRIAAVRDGNDL